MRRVYFISTVILIILASCSQNSVDVKGYISWIKSKGHILSEDKSIGEMEYHVTYQPLNYQVIKRFENTDNITKEEFEKYKEEKNGLQYFLLRIKNKSNTGDLLKQGIQDYSEYNQRVQYYSFQVNNDIVLVEGQDTLKCVMSHFERDYGLSGRISLALAFQKREDQEVVDKHVIFNDVVFGNGKIHLNIKSGDLKKEPLLTIE